MKINIKILLMVFVLGLSSSMTSCMSDEVIEPVTDGATLSTGGQDDDDPIEPGDD